MAQCSIEQLAKTFAKENNIPITEESLKTLSVMFQKTATKQAQEANIKSNIYKQQKQKAYNIAKEYNLDRIAPEPVVPIVTEAATVNKSPKKVNTPSTIMSAKEAKKIIMSKPIDGGRTKRDSYDTNSKILKEVMDANIGKEVNFKYRGDNTGTILGTKDNLVTIRYSSAVIRDIHGETVNVLYSKIDDNAEIAVPNYIKPESINVFHGSNDNIDLSNFAIRPFNYAGDTDYQSVEQGFQVEKFDYVVEDISEEDIKVNKALKSRMMKTTDGAMLKRMGRQIRGLDEEQWTDAFTNDLMRDLILMSFEQNPEAAKRLVDTKDSNITHYGDSGKWKTKFPEILMKVRSELVSPVVNEQGSTEDVGFNTLFNEELGDTLVNEEQIDLGENRNLIKTMLRMLQEDAAPTPVGKFQFANKEDFDKTQSDILVMMQDALDNTDFSKITLKEIETSLDEAFDYANDSRETAGSIAQRADKTADVTIRWNRFQGTARKSEVFMHEIVHFLTNRAFNYDPVTKGILGQLKDEVMKTTNLSHTIFLQDILADNNGSVTSEDIEVAKRKFEYVFGENADPEEFFAYAATNEHVYNAIKNVNLTPSFVEEIETAYSKDKTQPKTFGDLINKFIKVLNSVWVAVTQTKKNGGDIIVSTMKKMMELQSDLDAQDIALAQEEEAWVEKFVNDADRKIAPWLQKMDKAMESLNASVEKKGTGRFTEMLENTIGIQRVIQSRFFQDIWKAITEKTDNEKWAHLYEMFRRGKEFTEKHTKAIADAVKRRVSIMFKDADETTRKAITSIVFQLDLPSLEEADGSMDMKTINNMLIDDANLEKSYLVAIGEVQAVYRNKNKILHHPYKTWQEEFAADKAQAEALAKHMNDEKIHSGNQQFNASNIYNKFYLSGQYAINPYAPQTALDKDAIKKLNKLITIMALRHANKEDKKIVHKYLSTEAHRKNVAEMMNMYKSYITDTADGMKLTNFDSVKKGYFEAPNGNNMKFDVVSEEELEYYTGFFGKMKNIGELGTIDGKKYYKVTGRSHELGYEEGMFSIAGQGVPGISLKQILTQQLRADNKDTPKSLRISNMRIDDTVQGKIEKMAMNGGISNDIVNLNKDEYLVPVYDVTGSIVDYKIQLDKVDKIENMKLDTDVANVASYTFMKLKHREAAMSQNKKVVDTLLKYSDKHVRENPEEFVKLEKHTKGPFIEEIHGTWNRIPDYTRNYIFEQTDSNSLVIPKNKVAMIIGQTDASLSNLNIGPVDLRGNKKTGKMILAIEGYIREILGYLKETIAIRMGGVVAANTISNMLQAWIHGKINPIEYIALARKKWVQLNDYRDLQTKLDDLRVKLEGEGENASLETKQRIKILEQRLAKNPFDILVQDGQFSPIVEDVNVDEDANGHLAGMIHKAMNSNKLLQSINPIKEFIFMDRNTPIYKMMLKTTQYGDVITREILREKHEADALKAGKTLTAEERQAYLNFLDQLFVNYSYTDNKYLKYFERILGVFFTKYLFRQAKAMHSVIARNPGRFATFAGTEQLVGLDLKSADDDYWNFFDSIMNRFAVKTPYEVGAAVAEPNLFNWLPSWTDFFSFN